MKLSSLEKVAWCLEDLDGEVTVPADIAAAARRPIERMLEHTGG
jgi:quinolinate synthase